MSRNQLIVQLQAPADADIDALFALEESLIQAFSQNTFALVDGHDIGQGRFNVFIYPTGSWGPVIERVKAVLKLRGLLSSALIVKRLKVSERYSVVWPEAYDRAFEL